MNEYKDDLINPSGFIFTPSIITVTMIVKKQRKGVEVVMVVMEGDTK